MVQYFEPWLGVRLNYLTSGTYMFVYNITPSLIRRSKSEENVITFIHLFMLISFTVLKVWTDHHSSNYQFQQCLTDDQFCTTPVLNELDAWVTQRQWLASRLKPAYFLFHLEMIACVVIEEIIFYRSVLVD